MENLNNIFQEKQQLILVVLKLAYSRRTRSMPWLLMPWILASPGHQQPWYWLRYVASTGPCLPWEFQVPVACLALTHQTKMHGEPLFDIAWCYQPHRMAHGQHLNLNMDMCWEMIENANISHINSALQWLKSQPHLQWVNKSPKCYWDCLWWALRPGHTVLYGLIMAKTRQKVVSCEADDVVCVDVEFKTSYSRFTDVAGRWEKSQRRQTQQKVLNCSKF